MPLLDATEELTKILGDNKAVWAAIFAALGGAVFKIADRLLQFKEKRLDDSAAIRVQYEKEISRLTGLLDQLGIQKRKDLEEERDDAESWEAKYHTLWDKYTLEWKDHMQAEGQIVILSQRLEQQQQVSDALRRQVAILSGKEGVT